MVNVSDVKIDEIPTPTAEKDRLALIFERQHHLATKYLPIEKENGLLQTEDLPVNINDRKGQARLKDFAWRTMEELFEATDALVQHPDNPEHFLEEMIDALHFFTELNILCGITAEKIKQYFEVDDRDTMEFLSEVASTIDCGSSAIANDASLIYITIGQCIGNAMNRLKNKPWKQTHIVTDEQAFMDCLMPAWLGFFRVLGCKHGLTYSDIFTLYFKKSEVNKFRIRSGY